MIACRLLLRCLFICLWGTAKATSFRSNGDDDDKDRVTSMPGWKGGDFCWKHYAGYLDATDDHQLFYWYHEATDSPQDKPLVLWLNGGPGCSSLGGMFTELGPFVLDKDLTITLNPYSFNSVVNLLFIEQPAGVGFSYPSVPANDSSTAIDTDFALRNFLKDKHPELQGRPFYVMGESYGGHYVPNTVKQIQESNKALPGDSGGIINIQGFAVGNGYTDWKLDFNANVPNGRYHALTSQTLFERAEQACGGDYARCFWPRKDVVCPPECGAAVQAAVADATDGSIDIYDIYENVCLHGQTRKETQITKLLGHRREALQHYYDNSYEEIRSSSSSSFRALQTVISPVFPTCIDDYTAKYLNSEEAQQAIHVRPDTIPEGQWSDCGNVEYDFNYESEIENYKEWTSKGDLQILIYNGDADYILSHMGNSAWINEGLNLTKSKEWTKWHGSDGQVAGYFETYDTADIPFTFLTVKGAGHMVPKDRPRHALNMLEQFLGGEQAYDKVEPSKAAPLCPS